MAGFCKQCSKALFHDEENDFERCCEKNESVEVVCEGCGLTTVDWKGKCVGRCQGHFKVVSAEYASRWSPSFKHQSK